MPSQSILLTFPDRWIRVVCPRSLQHCGNRVQAASDRLECWQTLTEHTPDVLMLSQSELSRVVNAATGRVLTTATKV